jgi:hypothetical protein
MKVSIHDKLLFLGMNKHYHTMYVMMRPSLSSIFKYYCDSGIKETLLVYKMLQNAPNLIICIDYIQIWEGSVCSDIYCLGSIQLQTYLWDWCTNQLCSIAHVGRIEKFVSERIVGYLTCHMTIIMENGSESSGFHLLGHTKYLWNILKN